MPEGTTAIGVDGDGVVSLLGVGTTVVHATVHDTSNVYAESHANVVVTVLPKSVTVTTQSATKAYDGTPLTADGTCEGLVGGDVFKTTGTQTDAGSSTNTYTITKEGTDVSATANYNITESLGTLKVTCKPTTADLKLSQSGSSATATATIDGFLSEEDASGTVQFYIKDTKVGNPVSIAKGEGGAHSASMSFDDVPANNYTITAIFTPSGANSKYLPSTATATGYKDPAQRAINGTRLYQKTYGDEGFSLDLSLSDDVVGPNDTWSYSIVYDSHDTLDLGPSITLSDAGTGNATVTVKHAGKVVIRATVTDGRPEGEKLWSDATAYVAVDIAPAPLTVISYASDSHGTKVTSVPYGQVGALSYGLRYEGLVNGDTAGNFTNGHGILMAVPLVPTIDASGTPYPVRIARIGARGTISKDTAVSCT